MNKPNPYINTLYLAVHLALNILVVVAIVNVIDVFFPIKHFFSGYHFNINLRSVYPPTTTEKNVVAVLMLGVAAWYYQKRKARNADGSEKHYLPNLRQLEEYFRSKF
ncbi:hypothetical protein [Mucilaginibacter gracilis]|nr:hypothetical protein [Mucilaginibacter gracilis]